MLSQGRETDIRILVPDGGAHAWLTCLGSFFLMMNSFGLTNSFGIFQTFYETQLLPSSSPSAISWIGSVQSFLLTSVGIAAGPIYDRGHLKTLILVGGLLVIAGTFLTGLCSSYWQLLLTQGLLAGIGAGFLMLPSVAILSQYFRKHLAIATGLASSGSAVGSVLYPIMFNSLQPHIGFRYCTWIMALLMFFTLSISLLSLQFRFPKARTGNVLDISAWKDLSFNLWAAYLFISILGLYVPSFYIQLFGLQFMEPATAFYLLPVLNAGGFSGRILPPLLADRVGDFNILMPSTVLASLMGFLWTQIQSTAGAFAFCACYGVLIGAITTVVTPIDITMCPREDLVGVRLGMLQIPWALGLLVGTPVGGAILGKQHHWLHMQLFVGIVLAMAAVACLVARASKHGWKLRC